MDLRNEIKMLLVSSEEKSAARPKLIIVGCWREWKIDRIEADAADLQQVSCTAD